MPHMTDVFFSKSVIYIFEHNNDGAIGIIINKSLNDSKYKTLFKELSLNHHISVNNKKIFFGGPILIDKYILLHKPLKDVNPSIDVTNSISISSNKINLEKIIGANDFPYKVMMGHAGWRPGQLENEIKKGDWMMQSMTDDFVFNIQSNSMWEQAISSLDHNWANGANA